MGVKNEIYRKWALVGIHQPNDRKDISSGYWEFDGMDVLTITPEQLCSFSFFDGSTQECSEYAHNIDGNILNVFHEPVVWESSANTFSVMLKIVECKSDELVLLYTIYNPQNELRSDLAVLTYIAIKDYPQAVDSKAVVDSLLFCKRWVASSLEYRFFLTNDGLKANWTESKVTQTGDCEIKKFSDNLLLAIKDTGGKKKLFQIEKVLKSEIEMTEIGTGNKLKLKAGGL